MARKTKAELAAEFEAEHQAQLAVAKASYTERMMAVLERAVCENFELNVSNGKFVVEDRDERRRDAHLLQPTWTETADMDLYSLEVSVELKEEARAESERLSAVRRQAFLKLTEEEQQALGLTDRNNW
jgi:hypothetical protein